MGTTLLLGLPGTVSAPRGPRVLWYLYGRVQEVM